MTFRKNSITLLCTLMSAVVFSPLAVSGVADLKSNGSVKGYNLIEDSITSSQSNPGFVTNDLGSDNYKPKFKLDGASGRPTNIDLTNGTGAPAISLVNTHGTNGQIADQIVNSSVTKGVWMELYKGNTTSVGARGLKVTLKLNMVEVNGQRYYLSGQNQTFNIPFSAKAGSSTSSCNGKLIVQSSIKRITLNGCTGPRVSGTSYVTETFQCPNGPGQCTGVFKRTVYATAQSYYRTWNMMY
ncbi:hypothetical protein [Vibrio cyclitrophicus]|uniref:hypothetical protein n=1 Tax=Vibrio cyclitrophicus TaxID=47951 RepID=UPI0032E4B30F